MKQIAVLTGVLATVVAVSAAAVQKGPAPKPEKPEKVDLAARIGVLESAVTALQSSATSSTVFAGSIDLNGQGDVVLDQVAPDNIRRVRHFAEFPVVGLLADQPPTISLFQRRRTESSPPFATTTGFILANPLPTPASTLGGFSVFLDPTIIVVEDGKILVQFRAEIFNPSTSPTPTLVRYGLDGPGGTGDYRLVVVR